MMKFTFYTPSAGDFSKKHLIKDCLAMDAAVKMPENQKINPALYEKLFDIEPQSFTFIIEDTSGRTAGFMAAVNLTEEAYKQIKGGKVMDCEVVTEDSALTFKDNCRLYLLSVAVHPDFYGNGLGGRLLEKLNGQVEALKSSGISVSRVLVDAADGRTFGNLAEYGYKVIRGTKHNSVLMEKSYQL